MASVVPFPWDSSIPMVKQYQAALKAHDASAEPGFVSLEGYMVGRVAIMALENVQGEVTRETFLAAVAQTGTFDLGGVTLTYGQGDNQGMDNVFLSIIQADGTFKAVQRLGGSS